MKVLSITTATNHLSVALTDGQKVIAEKNEEDQRNHSEHLDPMITEILKENNLKLADIDRFAVAQGPGSYTGLRIGVTTAKMFSSILQKDLVGISTLAALAKGIEQSQAVIVAEIDARNNNFFAGAYVQDETGLKNVVPDGHYHLDELLKLVKEQAEHTQKQIVFVGSEMEAYNEQLKQQVAGFNYQQVTGDVNQVHAKNIGFLAENAPVIDPDKMVPKYLRRTQAELDWHKKTGKAYGSDSDYVEEV
ncbi:tRNA (adenosine(37)-N6)-threonylcarbamoyltransferase complex dimerization subunit type 1 TsaB [Lactobacillus sp. PV034]|uniref:tRNA (adenosine(37)-N6)-threonylcarbamoyltransferase complex dimerization subunit type 1 TsaB n=1 Tax=Lactobacillus sp. PV034 TaxID=2594495 RepID=UPI00223EECC7|nr:tRNA (adenosine(37)-N6)-threonylcarbamoyltransferase complex dimerization subunit type 1 TsaB [Lactobacillus sp. PV034]QNQ81440.1 tRNA (adenosine(37)-N6)-threonylcarbamoyltransferase complex dimerization subunit type 1 TsaB [Lactobacillus sp. PV034]